MTGSFLAWWSIAAMAALSIALLMRFNQQLSFGHALYFGLGAYAGVISMRFADFTQLSVFIFLVPLVAALAALLAGFFIQRLLAEHTGMSYAMMTFGLGELMHQAALALPLFGGESGLSGNRTAAGLSLMASSTLVNALSLSTLGLVLFLWWRLEKSELGFQAKLVRDNALRASSLGLSVIVLRWKIGLISAAMAGLAGGLAAWQFEIASPEVFSARRSGEWLIAALMLGSHWVHALTGAALLAFFSVVVAQWTAWWPGLYALLFVSLLFWKKKSA
jgi:branched-chain amino acid transport system permease protein